ncbi:hypothetical protein GCM10010176_095290 [Nonomuraea spiralis]|nr:hypothetical protein GCM10010176_095290 [Nonomuraea spiralis]
MVVSVREADLSIAAPMTISTNSAASEPNTVPRTPATPMPDFFLGCCGHCRVGMGGCGGGGGGGGGGW